jgi:hypothetical protein
MLFFILGFDAIGLPTTPINFHKIGEVIFLKIYLTYILTDSFYTFKKNCA